MEGVERPRGSRILRRRLNRKRMGCCGAVWIFGASREENDENCEDEQDAMGVGQIPVNNSPDPAFVGQTPAFPGMNSAMALAAERNLREEDGSVITSTTETTAATGTVVAPATPLRVPLMRPLEEADGVDGETEKEREVGNDGMCCVCMERKKGTAFIPCGHTFCRVCSRELWLNRGLCPLCNRPILEILDIGKGARTIAHLMQGTL